MEILPANKYLSNSPTKQLLHMASELWEVLKALIDYKLNPTYLNLIKLTCEIIDLQSSCQTMLRGPLKLSDGFINYCRKDVYYKNNARGYYEVRK